MTRRAWGRGPPHRRKDKNQALQVELGSLSTSPLFPSPTAARQRATTCPDLADIIAYEEGKAVKTFRYTHMLLLVWFGYDENDGLMAVSTINPRGFCAFLDTVSG